MNAPDRQAGADYSRGNRASRGPESRFAEPISGGATDPAGDPGADPASDPSTGPFTPRTPPARGGQTGARWAAARLALIAAGAAGSVALIVADLLPLYEIRIGKVVVSRVSGHGQHAFALLLLGVAALAMLFGALRGAAPATLALATIGVAAVIAGPVADTHDVSSSGLIGDTYAGAAAHARIGYRLETAGSILVLLSGGGLAFLYLGGPGRVARIRRRSEPTDRSQAASGLAPNAEPASGLAPNPYADE